MFFAFKFEVLNPMATFDHIKIIREVYDAMHAAAYTAIPLEACGLCGGVGNTISKFIELCNDDASTEHYTMKPEEQFAAIKKFRADGLSLRGIWHSHPTSSAQMSAEDLRLAYTEDVIYFISSVMPENEYELRGYLVELDKSYEIRIEVV